MLKVGVPRPRVKHKMKADGVDETVLDMDPEKPGPLAGGAGAGAAPFKIKGEALALKKLTNLNKTNFASLEWVAWNWETVSKTVANAPRQPTAESLYTEKRTAARAAYKDTVDQFETLKSDWDAIFTRVACTYSISLAGISEKMNLDKVAAKVMDILKDNAQPESLYSKRTLEQVRGSVRCIEKPAENNLSKIFFESRQRQFKEELGFGKQYVVDRVRKLSAGGNFEFFDKLKKPTTVGPDRRERRRKVGGLQCNGQVQFGVCVWPGQLGVVCEGRTVEYEKIH